MKNCIQQVISVFFFSASIPMVAVHHMRKDCCHMLPRQFIFPSCFWQKNWTSYIEHLYSFNMFQQPQHHVASIFEWSDFNVYPKWPKHHHQSFSFGHLFAGFLFGSSIKDRATQAAHQCRTGKRSQPESEIPIQPQPRAKISTRTSLASENLGYSEKLGYLGDLRPPPLIPMDY